MIPVELLRPGPAIFYSFWRFFAYTGRDFKALQSQASVLNYGWIFPFHIFVLVISLCYSIISPLVLLPALLYFAAAWIVHKNQIMYVYIKQSENNGQFWVMAYNRVILGILIFQFLTTGILSSKKAAYPAIWCAFLLPITWAFHKYCKNAFKVLDKLPAIDIIQDGDSLANDVSQSEIQEYKPPQLLHTLPDPITPTYLKKLISDV